MKTLQTFLGLGPSQTNVCEFVKFHFKFPINADITPNMLKLCMVNKVKVLFPVLVSVFYSVQF